MTNESNHLRERAEQVLRKIGAQRDQPEYKDIVDVIESALSYQDRTGRRQTQAPVEDDVNTLLAVLESNISGYWDWNIEKDVLYLSPAWKKMLGYAADELENNFSVLQRLMLPGELKKSDVLLTRHFETRGQEPFCTETAYRHRDGRTVGVICSGKVIRWAKDGKPLRMVGLHIDITQTKDTERRLSRTLDEVKKLAADARAASDAKSSFLANMSHEIRTPMNGILGMIEVLCLTPLDEKQRGYATIIRNSSRALLELLDNVLDMSRLSEGKAVLEPVPFNLQALLGEVIRTVQPQFDQKGLALKLELPEHLPASLYGDPDRLAQVISHLLSNALKFTEHGSVTVVLEEPFMHGNACHLAFTISDTGVGMPREKIREVFECFTQVDGSLQRKYNGAGLGLSICKGMVELMGGKLTASSDPGVGSRFRFTVRMPINPEVQPSSTEIEHARALDKWSHIFDDVEKKILVVEDHAMSQEVTATLLRELGLELEMVSDGPSALDRLRNGTWGAVLLDLNIPSPNGLEVATYVRDPNSDVQDHNVPLIALTSFVLPENREDCRVAGLNDFLAKPIEPLQLARVLARWLR